MLLRKRGSVEQLRPSLGQIQKAQVADAQEGANRLPVYQIGGGLEPVNAGLS